MSIYLIYLRFVQLLCVQGHWQDNGSARPCRFAAQDQGCGRRPLQQPPDVSVGIQCELDGWTDHVTVYGAPESSMMGFRGNGGIVVWLVQGPSSPSLTSPPAV